MDDSSLLLLYGTLPRVTSLRRRRLQLGYTRYTLQPVCVVLLRTLRCWDVVPLIAVVRHVTVTHVYDY